MKSSPFLLLGTISAFFGVGFGAFGAHALKTLISPELMVVYQTGVTYQMWHSLALIAIAVINQNQPQTKLLSWAGWLMFAGIIIFSGSLYLLAILNQRWLGMITPIGGVSFLSAWLLLAIFAAKSK